METLRGTAKTSGKICEMQGGKEFYEKYFQLRSGTSLTIDEAKKMLLDDINAKYSDFYSKLLKLNQQQNDELMKHMSQDPSVAITTGSFESDVEFCKDAIKSDFPDIGDVKYTIYHIPEALSKNLSPAAYMSTPVDDINKNVLMLNDHSDGLGDMLTTVAHEAFPGHLFEAVYHMQHMNSFYQKGGTTAYKEGWSTYSEDYIMKLTTGYDLQVYECFDIYIALLNYQMQAYLDICVHYDGWGRDEVVNFSNQYFPGAGEEISRSRAMLLLIASAICAAARSSTTRWHSMAASTARKRSTQLISIWDRVLSISSRSTCRCSWRNSTNRSDDRKGPDVTYGMAEG